MRKVDSLSRPIVGAFILFGMALSLFFAVLAAVVVEGIEVHLVDERLAEVEKWARPRAAAGLTADLPAGLRFHRGEQIPGSLRGLSPGVSEAEVDGIGLHVLTGADELGPYVVVDHESDYEQIELLVYSMFAALFGGFVILALFLGRFVGRRIVTPIRELADAVGHGASFSPHTQRGDELGILARALDAHTSQLRQFLDRERFFTGDVSHELRTPLTVIMGAAEILVENAEGPAVRAPAQRIYRAAQEATECVTVMLLLARAPQLGSFAPVSVSAIARRETQRYQSLVTDKPVTLRCVGRAEVSMRAPAELCASALANLVRNACQYTEQGEVTVLIEAGRITVEDTGRGLPEAVRRTLGEGEGALAIPSSGSAGTGLGLSLVRRICEYLGAALLYQDREGGGSRFTIIFPADFTQS